MSDNLFDLVGQAQTLQAVRGSTFKLDFGPAMAPLVMKDLESIAADLIAKGGARLTLEAIFAGGLKSLAKEYPGDPDSLNDAQKEELARVLRRIHGKTGGSRPLTQTKASNKKKK